ncbi:unnamed protein product [Adineta ricciae]|uniref:Delta(24)-sterol reductase n=1 Tax=Adineta ricciae TaxID=249248 RepID=A0A814VCN2_ADIRI|nr:unnamed protein product [Adineta ricciae]CAF1186343.1 unnamed protein product [Adineta ricciae]
MRNHSQIYEFLLTIKWAVSVYIRWFYQNLLTLMRMKSRKAQSLNVEYVAQTIRKRPNGSQIKIQRHERHSPSNSIRHTSTSSITNRTYSVHMGSANLILSIDKSARTVTCEPGVTMEELVDALLAYDLVPTVVPEFKNLTVGGILAGAGLESSSFRHGQFSDSLIEATYVLSNGDLITCSPTKDSDLFYGALGSCGTFGLLARATLRVLDIPFNCFVQCNYHWTKEPIEFISTLDYEHYEEDYIDAIVFSDHSVVITGQRIDESSIPKGERIQRFSRSWDPWYYQHVKKLHDRSRQTVICEYIPLKDYLFRYDRGAFWMGYYPLYPFDDKTQHLPFYLRKLINLIPFGGYNIISRTLLSPLFTTSALYQRLHASCASLIADTLLIQDIYIPISQSKQFLTFLQTGQLSTEKDERIEPIWLCPIRSSSTAQKLSPHYTDKDQLFINFGLWSHQYRWQTGSSGGKNATKVLENEAKNLRGRKMLYALSFYSQEQWSTIYDTRWYRQMKKKWDPNYAWGDVYDKVVQQL